MNRLQLAVRDNRFQEVQTFVDEGDDIYTRNVEYTSKTLLHIAAISDCDPEIVTFLIGRGMKVNEKDRHGNTPLHHATTNFSLKMVKHLLYHGADPNITNDNGLKPIDLIVPIIYWAKKRTINLEHSEDIHYLLAGDEEIKEPECE